MHFKEHYDRVPTRAAIGFNCKPNQFARNNYVDGPTSSLVARTGFAFTAEVENVLRVPTPTLVEIDEDNQTVDYDDNQN